MPRKKPCFLTIADPITSFDPEAETTFYFLKEISRRKFESWICELSHLFLQDGMPHVVARKVDVTQKGKKFAYTLEGQKIFALNSMDVVFLRKDPPVDLTFLMHLTMLEAFENSSSKQKPLFINSPSGIKKANEKI